MTLRARLSALTIVLLGSVLAAAGVALAKLDATDVERSLDQRARDRAAGAVARLPDSYEFPERGSEDEPRYPDRAEPNGIPEPDGARCEVFLVNAVPSGGRGAGWVLHSRSTKEVTSLNPGQIRDLAAAGRRSLTRLDIDGVSWVVAVEPGPASRDDLPPPPPPPPRGGMDGGPPPPPPPPGPPPRLVAVAFLEAGPARGRHDDFVTRMGLIGLAALVGGGALAWGLSGRMLKPVRTAAVAAEAIERAEQRLPEPKSKDELSRLVAVLNGMLARLEAASARERKFIATASHELRRPLTALLGELELARKEGRDAQSLRASVSLASEDAQAMKRLVEDLLHHARAQAGTLRLVETQIDLVELVVEAAERSRRTVPGSLHVRVGDLPAVTLRGDADALREVLENLLVNAGVHGSTSPGGEAGVMVDVGAEVADGEVLIHVDDDGEGISAEDMARIFEPFARGDRTKSVPGFGLGLSIARDTAEAHGGRVTVVSPLRPGDEAHPGTRFTLHLPDSRIVRRDGDGHPLS